jgi:hypothetical protein
VPAATAVDSGQPVSSNVLLERLAPFDRAPIVRTETHGWGAIALGDSPGQTSVDHLRCGLALWPVALGSSIPVMTRMESPMSQSRATLTMRSSSRASSAVATIRASGSTTVASGSPSSCPPSAIQPAAIRSIDARRQVRSPPAHRPRDGCDRRPRLLRGRGRRIWRPEMVRRRGATPMAASLRGKVAVRDLSAPARLVWRLRSAFGVNARGMDRMPERIGHHRPRQ